MLDANVQATLNIIALLKVDASARDEGWKKQFLETLPQAYFKLDPMAYVAGNGFSYLRIVAPTENDDVYAFTTVVEQAIASGLGVFLSPAESLQADYTFNFGDLWWFQSTGVFYAELDFADEVITMPAGTAMTYGEPSEHVIPARVQQVLDEQLPKLKDFDGKAPKFCVVTIPDQPKTRVLQVVTSRPLRFATERDQRAFHSKLGWYFPKHYRFIQAPVERTENVVPILTLDALMGQIKEKLNG